MRKGICVPTIALCLLLTACGGAGEEPSANLRNLYHDMTGCTMEATVTYLNPVKAAGWLMVLLVVGGVGNAYYRKRKRMEKAGA